MRYFNHIDSGEITTGMGILPRGFEGYNASFQCPQFRIMRKLWGNVNRNTVWDAYTNGAQIKKGLKKRLFTKKICSKDRPRSKFSVWGGQNFGIFSMQPCIVFLKSEVTFGGFLRGAFWRRGKKPSPLPQILLLI